MNPINSGTTGFNCRSEETGRGAKGCFARRVAGAVLLALGYYLGARIGLALTFQPHPVSVMWPPNSILLAALLLAPVRNWGLLLIAAFPAHLAAELQSDVPLAMVLSWFASNACEALIGAAVVWFFVRGPLRFDSLRNVAVFAGGIFLGSFVSSFLDAGFVALNHWGREGYWGVWRMRIASNVFTALTVAPVIVTWSRVRFSAWRTVPNWRRLEAIFVCLSLPIVSFLVFWREAAGPGTSPVLIYAPLPLMMWAAVRFGPAGASAALLTVALSAIWGAIHQHGPFSSGSPEENALSIQMFLTVLSITLLPLAAVLKERRHVEQTLRSSEEQYRAVVDSQSDLICRYLPDTTLTFVNEAYCRFFGKSREELIGRKFLELIPQVARASTQEHIAALASQPGVRQVEHEVLLPDGTTGWQQWTDQAIHGPDGAVAELQGIGRDITDRKHAEEARANLAHASRLAVVGELTAMIAHEVNQPLGAILSNAEAAEMLLDSSDPPLKEIRQILADIRMNDLRADAAIRRIRVLLRKREMEMQPLDLNEAVSDVLRLVSGDALRRRVQIRRQLARDLPPVFGDRVHLQQVLLNLIVNAMDAMNDTAEADRLLAVHTKRNGGGTIEVEVVDAGHGVAPDKLSRIFESFFTTKKEGMGLGLSIARSIIETHRGRLWAENNSSRGATFHFTVPLAENAAGQEGLNGR